MRPVRHSFGWCALPSRPAALAVLAAPAAARAEVKRYAFLVGANKGAAHEAPLRYAESDVSAVAEVLTELGGFPSERVVRLQAATAPRVRAALMELILTIQRDLRSGGEAVLFAYYSGHADAQNLHLGGTEMPTEEISNLVRLSQAKLKVLLLDACRSGALTQVKGGRPVAPFQIGAQDLLRNEGYAIITSSTAGEDSQESQGLRSSVFTHHFLGGLRGLADLNRDRLVTLGEAYAYASEQTLKTSMNTVAGLQHATFEYDLRGRADPVLSDLRRRGELAELVLGTPGEYLLMDAGSGALLFEAGVKQPRTPLQLAAGRYRVRTRTEANVYETELALNAGEIRALQTGGHAVDAAGAGGAQGRDRRAAGVRAELGGPCTGRWARGFRPCWECSWAGHSSCRGSRWCRGSGCSSDGRSRPPSTFSRHTLREITAELAGLYVFDFGRLALAPSLSVGWGFFEQRQERATCVDLCEQVTRPQGLITTVGGWASWPLGGGFALEASLELANFYLRRQTDTESASTAAPRAPAR